MIDLGSETGGSTPVKLYNNTIMKVHRLFLYDDSPVKRCIPYWQIKKKLFCLQFPLQVLFL